MVSPNLFFIYFNNEDDLEFIMKGRPWFFRRQSMVFDRLMSSMERCKFRLVVSPFWLKIGSCPPECDKEDLMHVVKSTFGD